MYDNAIEEVASLKSELERAYQEVDSVNQKLENTDAEP